MRSQAAAFLTHVMEDKNMLRSQVREEIFKILFRYPFTSEGEMEEQIAFSLEELAGKSEENIQYIQNKVRAIIEHTEQLDQTISEHCEGWNLNRIGKAEIAIMRIAVYEMLYEEESPQSVAINEAVELTKRYCDEEAKGFVNAVLGKVAKAIEK
jgi:N utilization substance protein B